VVSVCIVVVIVAALVSVSVFLLLKRQHSFTVKLVGYLNDVKKTIFWNTIIRTFIQSYLEFSVSTLLLTTVKEPTISTDKPIDPTKSDYVKAGLQLSVLIVVPIGLYCLLRYKFKELGNEDVKQKIGTLYEGIKSSQTAATTYFIVFMVRRLLFAFITVFAG
jgi:hypothetical protein